VSSPRPVLGCTTMPPPHLASACVYTSHVAKEESTIQQWKYPHESPPPDNTRNKPLKVLVASIPCNRQPWSTQ
jgi:hypothetical protein